MDGFLLLVGNDTLTFAPTKPSKKWTKIKFSTILDVELEQPAAAGLFEESVCRLVVSSQFI